ncbi:hypothetical protein GSI_11118 [Ganoderma sinense ZZ0214-1]|uniref:Uncharacterized protein n=1 Tax=Ganoderma sinense ZZ0214-1 TaxID=1077348 RepID=A0A2G8RZ38_9APHY|nr:hypothetical protein GSI_11118 [Ganoderma sinense ZZ0214-1]
MSQAILVSREAQMNPKGPVDIPLTPSPSSANTALPHIDDGSDVELVSMRRTPDVDADIEAGRIRVVPRLAPAGASVGNSESAKDGPALPSMSRSDMVMSVLLNGVGLLGFMFTCTALLALLGWGIGRVFLLALPTFSPDGTFVQELEAMGAGCAVIVLATFVIFALVYLAARWLSKSRPGRGRTVIADMSFFDWIFRSVLVLAPASVFAEPLGLVMGAGWTTERVGALHALALSAMGLFAPCVVALVIFGLWVLGGMCLQWAKRGRNWAASAVGRK